MPLRIRREEQLPVFERLGDVRSAAVTRGKIADVLMQKGDLDGALVLQEQRLETNRQLVDLADIAATQRDIAQIALARQQIEEAAPTAGRSLAPFSRSSVGPKASPSWVRYSARSSSRGICGNRRNRCSTRSVQAYRKLGRVRRGRSGRDLDPDQTQANGRQGKPSS